MSWTGLNWTPQHPRMLADLTGDGRADIVGFGDDGVYVALGNGDGTFRWAAGASDFGYGQGWRIDEHPRFITDITGDGRPDVVGFGNDGVFVALSNGDGSFQPIQLVRADFAPNANGWHADRHPRVMADVTGDGRADIVGFGDDDMYVALSNGDGTFQQPVWAYGDLCYNQGWRVDQHPRFLADVTGDGRADVGANWIPSRSGPDCDAHEWLWAVQQDGTIGPRAATRLQARRGASAETVPLVRSGR